MIEITNKIVAESEHQPQNCTMDPTLNLLLCYSSPDRESAHEFHQVLGPLLANQRLCTFRLEDVAPGGNVVDAFCSALKDADAAVLLLSSDFFGINGLSRTFWDLLAEEKRTAGLRLVPVVLRPCLWQEEPVLANLQPLPVTGHAMLQLDKTAREAQYVSVAHELVKLPKRLRTAAPKTSPQSTPPLEPPGLSYNPSWFIERNTLETEGLRLLSHPGQPVLLWGPAGSGKSWMLHRLLEEVLRQDGLDGRATLINLQKLSQVSPEKFYRELGERVVDALDRDKDYAAFNLSWVDSSFRALGLPMRKLKVLVQHVVLPRCPRRLVIGFDGADALFGSAWQDEFYGMLRSWAEATSSPGFERLRIVLAVSRDPSEMVLSLKQSPFNLTQPLNVGGLTQGQLRDLAVYHGLSPSPAELLRLGVRTQGIIHHARQLCYEAAKRGLTLDEVVG